MKTVGAALKAHFGQDTTTLAVLWKVTRQDLTVLGFTSCDIDLVVSGVTYRASSGAYRPTVVNTSANLSVDNLEVDVVLDSAAITEADLLAGLYDYARVDIMICNWADLSQGVMILRRGSIGEVSLKLATATAELRGMAQHYQQTVGRVYTRRCNADFGDTRCSKSIAGVTVTGTVSAVSSNSVFTVSTPPAAPYGKLTWTSGPNIGMSMEVVALAGSVLTLFAGMPNTVAIGHAYSVYAGCDKNLSTCRDTYANVENFRGFPHIPGLDKLVETPNAH